MPGGEELELRYRTIYRKGKDWLARTWHTTRQAVASGRLRRYRAWLFQAYVLAALIAFSVLALLASMFTFLPFDLEVTRELQQELPAWVGVFLQWVSWPGYGTQSIILVGLVVIALSVYGVRWEAVSALFSAIFCASLNYLVKVAIRRPRPAEDLVDVFEVLNSYSFPSGHVMFYTAFFGFLLFLAFSLLRHSWLRNLVLFVLTALVVLVGVSRMYLGEHWASDVIAGYLLGSLSLIFSIQAYRMGKARYFTEQPVAPPEWEDQTIPPLDPHIIPLGAKANEHNPDRPRTRPPSPGSAQANPVSQTGSKPDRNEPPRGNGSGPRRD